MTTKQMFTQSINNPLFRDILKSMSTEQRDTEVTVFVIVTYPGKTFTAKTPHVNTATLYNGTVKPAQANSTGT